MQVKENSFHQIDGYVMLDKNDHYDDNNLPMALIKISTENITAEERRRITFKGNLATYFDVHLEPTEIYLYISAQAATFISRERASDLSMDTVPTSTGCPFLWHSSICAITAAYFPL